MEKTHHVNAVIVVMGLPKAGKSMLIKRLLDISSEEPFSDEVNQWELSTGEKKLLIIEAIGTGNPNDAKQDSDNLALLHSYLNLHLHLNIPVIFLVVSRFDDSRFEDEGSEFTKLLRAVGSISMWARTVTSQVRFVFALTHFMYGKKHLRDDYDLLLSTVLRMAKDIIPLDFPINPKNRCILPIENCPTEYGYGNLPEEITQQNLRDEIDRISGLDLFNGYNIAIREYKHKPTYKPQLPRDMIIGRGFHLFREELGTTSPFEIKGGNEIKSCFGTFVSDTIKVRKLWGKESLDDQEKYYFTFPYVPQAHKFSGHSGHHLISNFRPGFNVVPSTNLINQTVECVNEQRVYLFTMNENLNVSLYFLEDLHNLRTLATTDPNYATKWHSFFNTYGTHAIMAAYAGGKISKTSVIQDDHLFRNTPSARSTKDLYLNCNLGNKDLKYNHIGGEPSVLTVAQNMSYTDVNIDQWKTTLAFNPVMLQTCMDLVPISRCVEKWDDSLGQLIDTAINNLFFPTTLWSYFTYIGTTIIHGLQISWETVTFYIKWPYYRVLSSKSKNLKPRSRSSSNESIVVVEVEKL